MPNEIHDALLDLRPCPVDVAFDHKARHEIAIEQERGRQDGDLSCFAHGAVAIEQDRKGYRPRGEKASDATVGFADIHANNSHRPVMQTGV